MTTLSVRKFLAAALVVACLPLAPHTASAAPAANLPDFTDLVDKVGPAVVNIRTTTRVSNSGSRGGLPPGMDDGDMSEFFRRFFGIPLPQSPQSPQSPGSPRGGDNGSGSGGSQDTPDSNDPEQNSGVGSGFIISADGYVMTNAHVIEGADEVFVTLTDKREFKAKMIGVDDRAPTSPWSRSTPPTCRPLRSAIRTRCAWASG